MNQLELHVKNCRVIRTEARELKDIGAFLEKIENSSKSGTLTLESWASWFNKTYHGILSTVDSKLYLFANNDNSPENKCLQTIILRGASIRKKDTNKFIIDTANNERKTFIAANRQERNTWYSKIDESIRNAENSHLYQELDGYNTRYEEVFINSREIIVIDDNKQQGIIDPDIYQIECRVTVSGNTTQGQQDFFLVRLSKERTIKCVVEYILNFLAHKYNPILFSLISVNKKSFTNKTIHAIRGVDNLDVKLSTFK
eukprot:203344_1